MTEETDAVVVIVSEETGAISHAYKSQLVRGVTLEQLRAFLTSIFVKPDKPRSSMEWLRSLRGDRVKTNGIPVAKAETK